MEATPRTRSRLDGRVAYLFPGQGSQSAGMGRHLLDSHATARRVFEEADDVLGWSVTRLCREDDPEGFSRTEAVQPAMLTLSVAILRVVEEETELDPGACLGHSLGEYSALVAARALTFVDALRCVRQRAELMAAAAPEGTGMAAVLGLPRKTIEATLHREAGADVLTVANLNAPDQTVISGHLRAIERATPRLLAEGARKVVRLRVACAFHSPLMRPAADRLAEFLEEIPFASPDLAVLSNVTGLPHEGPENVRQRLAEQVCRPVLWEACVRWVLDQGVTEFFELGPGRVLCGLNRRIDQRASSICIDRPEALTASQEKKT